MPLYCRNAFGSYLDVLRGVTFNPTMADWLSFTNGASLQHQLDFEGQWILPDENYAREIMQLVSAEWVERAFIFL